LVATSGFTKARRRRAIKQATRTEVLGFTEGSYNCGTGEFDAVYRKEVWSAYQTTPETAQAIFSGDHPRDAL
jgi:hypothetical protein